MKTTCEPMNDSRQQGNAEAAPGTVPRIPEIRDLTDQLHFRPGEGRIWLQDRRMMLFHAEAFGNLRKELIENVGPDYARGILTRTGYIAGSRDAEMAWKVRQGSDSLSDIWVAGSQLHSLEGVVLVEPVRGQIDSSTGRCYLEFLWKNSIEDEAHINTYGLSTEPTCWMEIGYASGFLSSCMGKRILVREVECRSTGFPHCRAIAKPVDDWDNPEEDLKYFDSRLLDKRTFVQVPSSFNEQPSSTEQLSRRTWLNRSETIGASASFHSVLHKIQRVATTNASVLLLGESGVGKSRFAREVHKSSRRTQQPFIEINCAAIPEQLVESELFGVERGAYSGAVETRAGRFEIADKGTIFLDEIATLSFTAQGKLLRVLQTGELERLGSTKTIKVDVRVVAATNVNLQKAVKEGHFREDLFYRLNVFPIAISPLRERKDDIPILLEYYIDKFSQLHGRRITGVSPRALQAILGYDWPGNVRELENVVERGVILADDNSSLDIHNLFSVDGSFETADLMGLSEMGTLVSKSLAEEQHPEVAAEPQGLADWARSFLRSNKVALSEIENALVIAALSENNGNISKAAAMLKINRHQLDYRLKKLST